MKPSSWRTSLSATLVAAGLYVLVGWCTSVLSAQSGGAVIFWPGAGVALAACMLTGPAGAFGVLLGAGLTHMVPGAAAAWPQLHPAATASPWPLSALPSALMAMLGARLAGQWLGKLPALEQTKDYLCLVLLGGLLPALAVCALFVLAAQSTDPAPWPLALEFGLHWTLSNAVGVAIATPVALCFAPGAAEVWRARRLRLAVPVVLLTLTLVWTAGAVARSEDRRQQSLLEHDANIAAELVTSGLEIPLLALRAAHGLFAADSMPGPEQMRKTAAWWLARQQSIHAIGFSDHVRAEDLAAYERRMRRDVLSSFKVVNRSDPGSVETRGDSSLMLVRYSESRATTPPPIGFNAMSGSASRAAILSAWRDADARASEGFKLFLGDRLQQAVVIYLPVFDDARTRLRGVVFVAASMQSLLGSLMARATPGLASCLSDLTDPSKPAPLAGPPNCELEAMAPGSSASAKVSREIPFAGRLWQLRLHALPGAARPVQSVQILAVTGMTCMMLLCAFLLASTGDTARVERAVEERTSTLNTEVQLRRETELSWRNSEARLRAIFESARVGIVYSDLSGQIIKANHAYCQMLGCEESDLLTLNVSDITCPQNRARDLAQLGLLEQGAQQGYRIETRYLRRDGSEVPVQASVAPVFTQDGVPYAAVSVVEDISERLRLAEAEVARDVAQAANLAKNEFVSRMSHELRTPLNAMLGFAQLLALDRKHELTPHQKTWVVQIQDAGWHLLDMINDTLDLSLIEAGTLRVTPTRVKVSDLLAATLPLLQGESQRKEVHLQCTAPSEGLELWCDETRAKQVLINLLSNAIKYNRAGGTVLITPRERADGDIELTIEDTGIGMTPEQVAQLFRPYDRLGREKSGVPGTGIGLVITQKLITSMKGSLDVHSSPGVGSRFSVCLPKFREALPAAQGTGNVPQEVHYIEDNPTNVELMRGLFSQFPNVQLSVSSTGREGIESVRASPPQVLLLDMYLPDLDGLDVMRALRTEPQLQALPIVVLSADTSTERIREAQELGASHYLTKPLDIHAVKAVLAELIPQWTSTNGSGSAAKDGRKSLAH